MFNRCKITHLPNDSETPPSKHTQTLFLMSNQWISSAMSTFLSDIHELQNEDYNMLDEDQRDDEQIEHPDQQTIALEQFQHPDQPPIAFEYLYAQAISPTVKDTEADLQYHRETNSAQIFTSVSTFFHLDSHSHLPQADILICSQDRVLFYLHSSVILKASASAFETLIGGSLRDPIFRGVILPVDVGSSELDVILLLLYDLSPVDYLPTLECLCKAIDLMPRFDLSPKDLILPESYLYVLLLSIAPSRPMEVYLVAAHHHIHALAVSTSAHLLSYPIHAITDSQALRMGAVYLRKYLTLRLARATALKVILGNAPFPHAPLETCGVEGQRRLTSVWAFSTSYVVWDSKADLDSYNLQWSIALLTRDIDCEPCKGILDEHVKDVIARWMAVKAGPVSPHRNVTMPQMSLTGKRRLRHQLIKYPSAHYLAWVECPFGSHGQG